MPAARPIVTLTTDFGTRDFYAAAMKAVLVRDCPDARLIDVTHQVPPQDILCGAITPERAIDGFLPGTIHLAVIDPGVGTDRRILVVEINRQFVVCPDNGLITWAWRRLGPGKAHSLLWKPESASDTFHGRDVMAPVAAMLACGKAIASIARPMNDPVLFDISPADAGDRTARVIHIDVFGNATTNMDLRTLRQLSEASFRVRAHRIGRLHRTYWDATPGEPLALIGSSGLLEIAVRDGSAAQKLGLHVGDEVTIE